jgi:hypothetical protein
LGNVEKAFFYAFMVVYYKSRVAAVVCIQMTLEKNGYNGALTFVAAAAAIKPFGGPWVHYQQRFFNSWNYGSGLFMSNYSRLTFRRNSW